MSFVPAASLLSQTLQALLGQCEVSGGASACGKCVRTFRMWKTLFFAGACFSGTSPCPWPWSTNTPVTSCCVSCMLWCLPQRQTCLASVCHIQESPVEPSHSVPAAGRFCPRFYSFDSRYRLPLSTHSVKQVLLAWAGGWYHSKNVKSRPTLHSVK